MFNLMRLNFKTEEKKGEAKAEAENAKGEGKALTGGTKGNDVKAEVERAKGKTTTAGERIKAPRNNLKLRRNNSFLSPTLRKE